MENIRFPQAADPNNNRKKPFLRRPKSKTMTTHDDDPFGGAETTEDPKQDELELKFLSTPEANEWLDWCDHAEEAINTSMSLASVWVPKAFLARILPEIKSTPYLFSHLREARAHVVAELGLPPEERK